MPGMPHCESWRLVIGNGMLGRFLPYADLGRIASLSHNFHTWYSQGFMQAWQKCEGDQEDVERVLGLAVTHGHSKHIEAMLAGAAGRAAIPACVFNSMQAASMAGLQTVIDLCAPGLFNWTREGESGFNPLVCAAQSGRPDVVEALLRSDGSGVDIQQSVSALGFALLDRHIDIARIIMRFHGEKVKGYEDKLHELLFGAVKAHNKDAVRFLLDVAAEGFVLWQHPVDSSTMLHVACFREGGQDSEEIARLLIEAGGSEMVSMRTTSGLTALHRAVSMQNVAMVQILVDAGGSDLVEMRANDGSTALHHASGKPSAAIAQILIDAGRSDLVEMQTNRGATALHYAVQAGNAVMTQMLIDAGGVDLVMMPSFLENHTALSTAVAKKNVDIARALMEVGGKPLVMRTYHSRGRTGFTALHVACSHGLLALAQALIEFGGKDLVLCKTDAIGYTALHLAVSDMKRDTSEIVYSLLEVGGRDLVMIRSADGTPLLIYAMRTYRDNATILRALLEVGGKALAMQVASVSGMSPLHAAVRMGFLQSTKTLVEFGGKDLVELKDKAGHSALDYVESSPTAKEDIRRVLSWAK